MKSRREIKREAKQAFAEQRGSAIFVLFWLILINGVLSWIGSRISLLPAAGFVGRIIPLAGMLVTGVLAINTAGTFVKIYKKESIRARDPFSDMAVNFPRKFGGFCWLLLWYFLWSLPYMVAVIMLSGATLGSGGFYAALFFTIVLLIPAIIKAISYSMAQYILAGCLNVTAVNALRLSIRMTNGYKGKLFVLALSFIGWGALGILPFVLTGIVAGLNDIGDAALSLLINFGSLLFAIFYTVYLGPYIFSAYAGFYIELRKEAIATGKIDPAEFDGAPPSIPSAE